MTLIVSVRAPDGIIIAGDSLLTVKEDGQPAITLSHTQKILPFYGKSGVGIFGSSLLGNKSVYTAIRLFEQDLKKNDIPFNGVTEMAQKMGDHFHNLLKEELEQENKSFDALQPGQFALGFHIVGYDDSPAPKTVEVYIGKDVRPLVREEFGCTYTGNGEIVQAIWELYKERPENQPPYPLLSLQNAIDYAEFLIHTTIVHQRLSRTVPNVGGNIDIAIVTFFDGFQWIHQKPLNQISEGN